jgi:tape measure domain-containing protein
MANVTTELKVAVKVAGERGLDQLKRSLVNIGKQSTLTDKSFAQLSKKLKEVQSRTTESVNNLRAYSSAWKDIANSVEIGSKEFREATAEAAKLDKQLQKTSQRRGGRLRAGAQIAGTVAGAGVFGGAEGAIGALAGAAFGGPAGAVVGGAIGAQLGGFRQAAGAAAEYSANLAKLRIALQGVTTSQAEYQQGLAFIQQTTKDFAIPQEVVTRQFTKLQASVQGAGGNLEDTKTAFNGIVAAVRATGGSLQDVDSALTATAQVFSKGKVSAEELRQQIGERLPGAFSLFAEAIGMTPQELDKALEKGQVSLQDFQKFAETIFERYGETAKIIASGPNAAGDRLKTSLERLNESVGVLLKPIGEAFQTVFTGIVDAITAAANALQDFLDRMEAERRATELLKGGQSRAQYGRKGRGQTRELRATLVQDFLKDIRDERAVDVEQQAAGAGLPSITPELSGDGGGAAGKIRADISQQEYDIRLQIVAARKDENKLLLAQLNADLARQKLSESDLRDRDRAIKLLEINQTEQENVVKILEDRANMQVEYIDAEEETANAVAFTEKALGAAGKQIAQNLNAQKEFNKEMTETEKLTESIKQSIESNIAGAIEAAIFEAKSLNESLSNILRQVASLLIQFGTKSLFSALPFANGGVFAQNGVVPFARGGVVNKPTLFPFANGVGLMGEAGPEAIMPLRRGPSGRLGVEATGGSSVVVNVDATGSQVQGDGGQAKMLGSAIGAAVQAELVKQSRPGGLLSR